MRTAKSSPFEDGWSATPAHYPKDLGLAWSTWIMSTGCYDIPALDFTCTTVYTNTGANDAYRGAGRPEAAYYIERVADLVADATGLDPVEVRRRNFIQPDQFPFTTLAGTQYDTGDYDKALDHALELTDYTALREEQARGRDEGRYIGIGLASYVEICGFGPYESSTVRVEPSGAISIFTGISPHGQGQETTFAQMAVDGLGGHSTTWLCITATPATRRREMAPWAAADSLSVAPPSWSRWRKSSEKAKQIAAHLLEASTEDIELEDGVYRVKGVPTRSVTLADIADVAYSGSLPKDIDAGLESTDFFRPAGTTFPFGTHIAVVEVLPGDGRSQVPALRLGGRLRQNHQPDAGDWAGSWRPCPGHWTGPFRGGPLR